MKKDQLILIASIVTGVLAAAATVILVLRRLKKKRDKIAPASLSFENDFSEEAAGIPATEESE